MASLILFPLIVMSASAEATKSLTGQDISKEAMGWKVESAPEKTLPALSGTLNQVATMLTNAGYSGTRSGLPESVVGKDTPSSPEQVESTKETIARIEQQLAALKQNLDTIRVA